MTCLSWCTYTRVLICCAAAHSSNLGLKSNRTGAQSGTLSPSGRNVSGLSVIAADHAGEGEEEWEQDMRGLRGDEVSRQCKP
jgi:hypothetical protein